MTRCTPCNLPACHCDSLISPSGCTSLTIPSRLGELRLCCPHTLRPCSSMYSTYSVLLWNLTADHAGLSFLNLATFHGPSCFHLLNASVDAMRGFLFKMSSSCCYYSVSTSLDKPVISPTIASPSAITARPTNLLVQ